MASAGEPATRGDDQPSARVVARRPLTPVDEEQDLALIDPGSVVARGDPDNAPTSGQEPSRGGVVSPIQKRNVNGPAREALSVSKTMS